MNYSINSFKAAPRKRLLAENGFARGPSAKKSQVLNFKTVKGMGFLDAAEIKLCLSDY